MKRFISILLALILVLCEGVAAANAQLNEHGNENLQNYVKDLSDDDTLAVGLDFAFPFRIIPTVEQVMAETAERSGIDLHIVAGQFLSAEEAREYDAVYRAVKTEMIRANVLAAMELLGLKFDEVADLGYSEDTVGMLGMPRRWRITKAKLRQLSQTDEVTNILYYPALEPIDYGMRLPQETAQKTPEEKLGDYLTARLSWLDGGEMITVIPQPLQLPNSVLVAAITAKYGEAVATDYYSEQYKDAAREIYASYYTRAFADLRAELGYGEQDVTLLKDSGYGRFAVAADRAEIMRIAACDKVESIEVQLKGFYAEAGCVKYIDTDSALFRRLIAWGSERYGDNYQAGVSRFNELYTQYSEDGGARWTILKACIGFPPPWEVKCGGVIAGRFIYSIGGFDIFVSGYALYDAEKDDFFALETVNETDYPGLREAIWKLGLGNPVGDADLDGDVTILDATRIQRFLANMDVLEKIGNNQFGQCGSPFADTDGDDRITILDATAIQRMLAELPAG